MSRTRRRVLAIAVATTLLSLVASCGGGGGGQLAEQSEEELTDTTVDAGAAIPTSALESPDGAAAAARELRAVEVGLRADDRDPRRLADLGRRQQLAYRALAQHPGWVASVLRDVPAGVRDAVRSNVAAGAALARLTGTGVSLPSSLPDWRVLAPLPASTLRDSYAAAEAATGVPWAYLAAIHLVETRMGRIHGTSTAGARGPMQFIPETWASHGEGDIDDDHDAIQAAGRYLASRGAPDDMDRALFSYNNDDRYVTAVKAYAATMLADPRAYDGYHAWQVFYATQERAYVLPEGYAGGA
ncbi:MAG: lytic transglycosylase domain-containing protein [Acidimicrobiia bacterium]